MDPLMNPFMNPFPNILEYIMNDDSDEDFELLIAATLEEEEMRRRQSFGHRGSVLGHRLLNRGRYGCHERLYCDCFCENSVYLGILHIYFAGDFA